MHPYLKVILAAALVAGTALGGNPDVPEDGSPIRGGGGFLGKPPTYLVLVKTCGSPLGSFVGSGAFITERLVLTCYHNVRGLRDGRSLKIHTVPGRTYTNISIEKVNPYIDLALLKVNDPFPDRHHELWIQDTYKMTPKVYSAGYDPSTGRLEVYRGRFNGRTFAGKRGRKPVYRGHSAKVVQGMSGGPLIDQTGSLIGVNVASHRRTGALAVRAELIWSFLDSYDGPYNLRKVRPPK